MNGAEEPGLRRRTVGELGRLCRADEHEPGAPEARHEFSVLGRHEPLGQLRAHVATDVLRVKHDFLDHERDAREGTLGKVAADLRRRLLGERLEHGVQLGIHCVHSRQRRGIAEPRVYSLGFSLRLSISIAATQIAMTPNARWFSVDDPDASCGESGNATKMSTLHAPASISG